MVLNKMKLEYCSSNISATWIAPLTVYEVKDNTVYIFSTMKTVNMFKYLLPFKVCIAEVVQNTSEFNRQPKWLRKERVFVEDRVNADLWKANLSKVITPTHLSLEATTISPTCFPHSWSQDLNPLFGKEPNLILKVLYVTEGKLHE